MPAYMFSPQAYTVQNGSAPGHFVVLTCFLIINRGNFGRALKGGHWIPLAPYQHSRGNFGRALINFLCIFSGFNNCGIYLVTSPACTFAHPFVIHHVCGFLSRHFLDFRNFHRFRPRRESLSLVASACFI